MKKGTIVLLPYNSYHGSSILFEGERVAVVSDMSGDGTVLIQNSHRYYEPKAVPIYSLSSLAIQETRNEKKYHTRILTDQWDYIVHHEYEGKEVEFTVVTRGGSVFAEVNLNAI